MVATAGLNELSNGVGGLPSLADVFDVEFLFLCSCLLHSTRVCPFFSLLALIPLLSLSIDSSPLCATDYLLLLPQDSR